jgi:hypothetical protein
MAGGSARPNFMFDNETCKEMVTMATTTLLDWILSILRDPDERAAFQHDPDQYAEQHGFGDLSSADVHDALSLIADNQSASYDHGGSSHVHYPPPQHYHNNDDAGHYLNNYITNNYTVIDDRDTNIDNSVHQKIDTDGGDFHQTNDNDTVIASGDGATAVGGDNNGDISSAGHDSTTAFGDGDANNVDFDHADFGSGSAVAVDGSSASGHAEDNDSVTAVEGGHGDTNVTTADDGSAAHQDVDHTANHEATFTHTDDHTDNSHTDIASHNPVHVDDVHLDAL